MSRAAVAAVAVFALVLAGRAEARPAADPPAATWFDAARAGDVAGLKRLVRKHPRLAVDATDDAGYSALVLAAYHDRTAVVRWLLGRGADPCVSDRRGYTALMGAVFRGHGTVVRALAAGPCGADHVTAVGQTPLMLAALFGRTELVSTLLAAGADPRRTDGRGGSARSLAEGQGHVEIVALLDAATR